MTNNATYQRKSHNGVPAFIEGESFRKMQLRIMIRLFARALEVEAPSVKRMSADDLLYTFAQFSATEIAVALSDEDGGARKANRLYEKAMALGKKLRLLPPLRNADPFALTSALYRNIDIGLHGCLPGDLTMCPCYFSSYYTPRICQFMKAFDTGIMSGIAGKGNLEFTDRISQGAPACHAHFALEGEGK